LIDSSPALSREAMSSFTVEMFMLSTIQ
jgi:hypothetical protein